MLPAITSGRTRAVVIVAVIALAIVAYAAWRLSENSRSGLSATTSASAEQSDASSAPARDRDSVDLSDSQLASVKVEPVEEHEFPVEKEAVGSIDFNEDMAVQVFTPYQGRIIALYASIGDDVKKGQTLFTIDSPDLLQAESTLIAAAGVLELTTRNLARLRELYKTSCGIATRSRAGGFRPADRRRQSAGGARCGAHFRQGRCRDRSHCRRSRRRPDAGRAEPD